MLFDDFKIISKKMSNKNRLFNRKKILITGALGFIGINFLRYFFFLSKNSKIKFQIIAIDNKKLDKKLKKIFRSRDFLYKKADLTKIKTFPKVDYVIHAASIASPLMYRKKALQTIDSNVFLYKKILDFYKKQKLKSLLYFSSSEVYGNPDKKNIPTSEKYNGNVSMIGPRSCYDESKRFGETLSVYYYKICKLPIKIVRPFNNYGPGLNLNDGRITADIFKSIINNKNIEIYSDGKSTRTYCYIADAIYGYLLLLTSKYNAEPFNIGNHKPEISVINLAKICIQLSNFNKKIVFKISSDKAYNIDSPLRRCPNINKASSKLGFKPFTNLKKGIIKTLSYHKSKKI